MATLVLAAAGSALGGGAVGGSVAGLGAMAVGKAAGALLGSAIDQRILGGGSAPVETGHVDQFRVMGSSEGTALPRVFGRNRIAGQIIWSSRFLEHVSTESVGGKGGGASVRQYTYSISLGIALSEGVLSRIGRIWADGQPVDQSGMTIRLHPGTEDQQPDPLIEAIEGQGLAPAYRGTAYVVIENLDLTPYGSRIPQFNFEVFRRPPEAVDGGVRSPALDIRGVALVPGTGEYALATEPVYLRRGKPDSSVANVHNDMGVPDLLASTAQLTAELPSVESVSLVATWFGTDLRCDRCQLAPAVEQGGEEGDPMPWVVGGQTRDEARTVSLVDGRPIFGGTPSDQSILQAIAHLREQGLSVMFYPFILMDIQAGNGLRDPWTGAESQAAVPWRGRITLARAPGTAGSSDKTSAAAAEVEAFFGKARVSDFLQQEDTVRYSGPEEWSYRRFILHYAHLCAVAGGVEAFCIGSEMRGLTQIRRSANAYPAVEALRTLAADVRTILGAGTKIGYAADWSEYFGHQPADGSGDVLFNLDLLWSSDDVDFVGIDNYMPLSDWRDGDTHADASAGAIYNLDYLGENVAGGEGFDWYYADADARDDQLRTPIVDGAYGEDWVFRYKDLVSWWSLPHHDRVGGVRSASATTWVPKSKPIWFTELGCPAVDKGTNQPNVFHDPKSSESYFPYYSSGARDDLVQRAYLQATFRHWADAAHNPVSSVYSGRMVDMSRAHVWAWDARPWPDFPDRLETWVDGDNYTCGHWLNGRASASSLPEVVAEICARSGVDAIDVSRLYGAVTGYLIEAVESGRQSLQPLIVAHGFDSFAVGESMTFASRGREVARSISADTCVAIDGQPVVSFSRAPTVETADRVTVGYVRADNEYQTGAASALAPEAGEPRSEQTSISLVMREDEAGALAARILSEGRVARDGLSCALPPSALGLTLGDVVAVRSGEAEHRFRIDRIEDAGARSLSATRIERQVYVAPPLPVTATFLDLPLLRGDEDPVSPHLAVSRSPWAGPVAVFSAKSDAGYAFERDVRRPATIGTLLDPLSAGQPGLWMPCEVRVRLLVGSLQSREEADVLGGANAAALRNGESGDWEVLQFRTATLISPQVYKLGGLLRGQAGTDWLIPEAWPAGTSFVALDEAIGQLVVPSSMRGVERHYRIGPAKRSYDDPSYVHLVEAFSGVGLRPYAPTHLSTLQLSGVGLRLRWVRRTRIDGDSWLGLDVPLGEEREQYLVRLLDDETVLREETVDSPEFIYSSADQASDGRRATAFSVAQISSRFGVGPFQRMLLNA
ncbi:MAG: glycoside hydrolase/phage tail family protein [Amaricoccus sp.]|uniref:baseplate multidomain protein megatron n=1 Tax=Amaricoccus sp. TaxID=1872485 RepID=UPI0039E67B5C